MSAIVGGASSELGKQLRKVSLLFHRVEVESDRVAFNNRMVKQSLTLRRDEMGGGGGSSCALSEDGDSLGVTTKGSNVPLNPLQSVLLIHEPVVAVEVVIHQKSEGTQAVVDDDHNGFSLTGNSCPIVQHSARSSLQEFTTREKHHHGIATLILRGITGGVNIQIQAILANKFRASERREGAVLNATRTECCSVAYPFPWDDRARSSPSEMVGWWCRERDSQEVTARLVGNPLEFTSFNGDSVRVVLLTPSGHSKESGKKN